MKINEIPDVKGNRYPEKITLSLSREAKQMLSVIKQKKKKDPAELMRMLLDKFIKENEADLAG